MIQNLNVPVDPNLISDALSQLPSFDFRMAINEPSGDFFYDPWIVKEEFKNTVWDNLLSTLPYLHGEARIVNLLPGEAYRSHADIDDRWHLALTNEQSYMIDLDSKTMYSCIVGEWHSMDASILHTAGNFGSGDRIHLLVRQLLTNANLNNPITCVIEPKNIELPTNRYLFDAVYSPVLNKLNKENKLSNFIKHQTSVEFQIEKEVSLPKHKDFLVKFS